jgi:hypothetical protein
MTNAQYDALYKTLYALLADVTPLKKDCGVLCGRACCRGDENTGMLLFPGEKTSLRTVERYGRRFALCPGACSRDERPLSCRIFPFYPAEDGGRITVRIDHRGYALCPLVRRADGIAFDPHFLRRMRTAGKLLCRDEACRAFLRELREEDEAVRLLLPR